MTEPSEPLSFEELLELHGRGLGLSDALVLAYVRGRTERAAAERVAQACRISERSAYRALKRLRRCRFLD